MLSGVATPLGDCEVVLPGGGGLGASTIPVLDGVVEGVGSALNGTESVVGSVRLGAAAATPAIRPGRRCWSASSDSWSPCR